MKILAMGTCCVDVYPQKNVVTPGGEALNIAAQLSSRSDVDVYLMAMIGDDNFADKILESIREFNIDTKHLYQVEGETANHVIQISKQGDRYFESGSWHGGVSANLSMNENDISLLSEVNAVMVTLWEPNLKDLLKLKNKNDYLVAVDFNDQRDFTNWVGLFDDIDIFFSSAEESMKKTFLEKSKTSNTIFVLTFGENGSVAYHKGHIFECAAVNVANVIDTTGCGDCYQGHFVAEYLKTSDIKLSMQQATVEAAKVTAHVGGFKIN
jgi:fructoselysine 6-kinase